MRTIKFRIWNTEGKCFYTDDHVKANFFNYIERTDEPIMQFTGLLDRHGKEIYEGDVVRIFDIDFGPSKESYSVEWHTEKASFLVNERQMDYYRNYITLEVIGNIYENH